MTKEQRESTPPLLTITKNPRHTIHRSSISGPSTTRRNYRDFTDCDTTEPANALVSSEYFSLRRTFEALSSISTPVCLPSSRCARTEPARRLAIFDLSLIHI